MELRDVDLWRRIVCAEHLDIVMYRYYRQDEQKKLMSKSLPTLCHSLNEVPYKLVWTCVHYIGGCHESQITMIARFMRKCLLALFLWSYIVVLS